MITQNWNTSGGSSGESRNSAQANAKSASGEASAESPESPFSFPQTPFYYPENESRKASRSGRGNGRRNSPENSGERYPSPSPTGYFDQDILERLTVCFRREWGRVPAGSPYEIIPREPDARESAQLRDLAGELSAANCPLDHIDQAFRDAAGRPDKMHLSYVRAILLDWLGIERTRGP